MIEYLILIKRPLYMHSSFPVMKKKEYDVLKFVSLIKYFTRENCHAIVQQFLENLVLPLHVGYGVPRYSIEYIWFTCRGNIEITNIIS